MNILFVADPLASFMYWKDTTRVMMHEADHRGHTMWVCEPRDLGWRRGEPVSAPVRQLHLCTEARDTPDWFTLEPPVLWALRDMDVVVMRKDPPFDAEYLYATHMLEQAEREGAVVSNRPRAIRDHSEKLAIMEFPEWIAPTIVTRDPKALRAFHAEHEDIVLKPLDGMGGMGIFRIAADGLNLGSAIETLNMHNARTVMAQRYLPAIADGDKRLLLVGGKPAASVLARKATGNEFRANLAVGGVGTARPLTPRDEAIAAALGPKLASRGLDLVGLDIIGDCVTEINVTSAGCFYEILTQTGENLGATFIDLMEGLRGRR
jgi:glutathione synthase